MKKNNFITEFTQIIGLIASLAIALSQYLFRDNFKYLFVDQKYYSLASLIALIISFVIMIYLYSNRYTISMKFYFSKEKSTKYFKYLNLTPEVKEKEKNIKEPWSYSIKKMAVLSIIMMPFSIFLLLYFYNNIIITVLSYIFFISSVVFSITTFAIQLYLENDYKNREKENLELTLEKIKSYFSGEIRVRWISTDTTNWLSTRRLLWIERNSKLYKVSVDLNDPDKFFYIEENSDPSFKSLEI